jgi:hypothetical protein
LLGIPRDWSLTITMQGRDVTDEPLTFSAGADVSDLVLHVTPRGAKNVPRSVCATP